MIGKNYIPRPSVYTLAHSALLELYKSLEIPITKSQAEHKLKVTPGIMFADGVTYDDVFKTLELWRLIKISGKIIEVLDWPKTATEAEIECISEQPQSTLKPEELLTTAKNKKLPAKKKGTNNKMKFKENDKVWFFDVDVYAIMAGQVKKSRDNEKVYNPVCKTYYISYIWDVPGIKSYLSHADIWEEFVAPRTGKGKKLLNKIVHDYLVEEEASLLRRAQSIQDYVNDEEIKSVSEKYIKGTAI